MIGKGSRTALARSHTMASRVAGGSHVAGNVGRAMAAAGEIGRATGKKAPADGSGAGECGRGRMAQRTAYISVGASERPDWMEMGMRYYTTLRELDIFLRGI